MQIGSAKNSYPTEGKTSAVKAVATEPSSSFVHVVSDNVTAANARQAVLGLLLGATLPLPVAMRSVLRPIWATEAMQRAYDVVRLVAALDEAVPHVNASPMFLAAEYRIADELAAAYRSLDFPQDTARVPCSGVLRTAVRDLVELFGAVAGSTRIRTEIQRLTLPMFRSRALVLVACRLVTLALGRTEIPANLVIVTLTRIGTDMARLRVLGSGCSSRQPDEIVSDLASLLESTPVYVIDDAGRITTQITFPIQVADPTNFNESE
jgi:hypothetical protein